LFPLLGREWMGQSQLPIQLGSSAPEPDVAVIKRPKSRYAQRLPNAEDISLVIEVSDSSLEFDRTQKQAIYAMNGIPVYWIVNIPERRVEVYSSPLAEEQRYTTLNTYTPGQQIPVILGEQTLPSILVDDLLPEETA
jgi:Uma2 family endonuclease